MNINKKILKTIRYFSLFAYYPTLTEIYTFLQAEISKNELKKELEDMVKQKLIISSQPLMDNSQRYTVGEYGIKNIKDPSFAKASEGRQISKRKLNSIRFRAYIKLLNLFSQIKLVGLSGSISMMNAGEVDDIDLFIITAKNRLFTGRLIALLSAQILGLRRGRDLIDHKAQISVFSTASPRQLADHRRLSQKQKSSLLQNNHKNKVCLNLFFDENDLNVPKFKQTEFVGHEVLQMKPIIIKNNIYNRFIKANLWVQDIFPNSSWIISKIKDQRSKTSSKFKSLILKLGFDFYTLIFDLFEKVVKKMQLSLINRHRTTEIITSSQLWFHPDDFGKKINKT